MEIQKSFTEHIKKVAIGTPLREAIDNILCAKKGGLIVFDSPELAKIYQGGFRINTKLTPEKLFELCKMDDAVVISPDLKKILAANVLLTPISEIQSDETGTRSQSAERTAKQAATFVISISERKNKTLIYYKQDKYELKSAEILTREITNSLHILEKYRDSFEECSIRLSIAEASSAVHVQDVCRFIQRGIIVIRVSESIKKLLVEMGREGNLLNLRYKELIKGVEKSVDNSLRDYSLFTLKKSRKLLEGLTFDNLFDIDSLAALLLQRESDEPIQSRGYRFLSKLKICDKEISLLVNYSKTLDKILEITPEAIRSVLGSDKKILTEEISTLRNQVLEGRNSLI